MDITNKSDTGVSPAPDCGDGNGLCLSPPMLLGKEARVNIDIGKNYIFYAAPVPQLKGNPAVGMADITVLYGDIAKGRLAFRTKLNSRAGRDKRTVIYTDIFTWPVMPGILRIFKDDAVIGGFNMTVADPDVLAVIGIDAVTICQPKIIQNTDAVNKHIVAARQMGGPEGASGKRNLLQRQVRDML